MRIPREYIQRYSDALNELGEQTKDRLIPILEQIDYSQDIATIRMQVELVMRSTCGASNAVSARLAADFYQGMRNLYGFTDGYEPIVEPYEDFAATDGAVRAFVQDLVEDKPREKFIQKCADRADYELRRSANHCTEANAKRDPKKPRWARVPMGAETCKWCIMLASRGFKYHTQEMASHTHSDCDCRLVPGFDDVTTVEGYDPDYYLDVYEHPEKHPEVRDAINARRRELRAERKAASENPD